MKDILRNLADIHLIEYCQRHGIDTAGTFVRKHGRGFTFALLRQTDGALVATVTFHKMQVPTFTRPF